MTVEKNNCTVLYDGLTGADGTQLAEPMSQSDAAEMGATIKPTQALIYVAGACSSTFDLAWELAQAHAAPPWTSYIAKTQMKGRGQLRRLWHSPPGNLYVSFFLPDDMALLENLAPLCTGLLIRDALKMQGAQTLLKWPNDLLLPATASASGEEGKFGGLLLEERNGRLLAGLGLNLRHAPKENDTQATRALPAAALPKCSVPVCAYWSKLLNGIAGLYEQNIAGASLEEIRWKIEDALAWRDKIVFAEDERKVGRLAGLLSDGSLVLETQSGRFAVSSGSVRLV